jgi:putative ABC transport system permease protein
VGAVLHRGESHPGVVLTPMLRRLWWIVASIRRRPALEAEMEAEMRAHLEMETEDLIRRGHDPTTARRHAAATFGGVAQTREAALEARALPAVADLVRSVRLATRTLLRHKAFAFTTVLALGLSIAVNTTTFSVLDAMLNPDVLASHPERLVNVKYLGDANRALDFTAAERVLRTGGRTYESFAGWFPYFWNQQAAVEHARLMRDADVVVVSQTFFSTMGVAPLEGRLSPPADPSAAASTVVISDRLRAELFPGRDHAPGQTILVEGVPVTVLGVARRYAAAPGLDADVWMFPGPTRAMPARWLRLRPGFTIQDAQAEVDFLAQRLAISSGFPAATSRFYITPTSSQFEAGRFQFALIGAGLAVLLIACTNLANLQLARGLGRSSEIAVQSALGATQRHVVMQLMTENAVMAGAGLAIALLCSVAGNALIRATIPRKIGTYIVAPHTSWRMVAFAAITAAVSLLLVGALPALRASRVDINSLLKSRAGTGAHKRNSRWYASLIVVQIAFAMPLATGAVLLALGAWIVAQPNRLTSAYGFDPTPIVSAELSWPRPDSGSSISLTDATSHVVTRALAIPHVTSAAITTIALPLNRAVTVEDGVGGYHQVDALSWPYTVVSPTYFKTLDVPMVAGTDFSSGDPSAGTIVIDELTAVSLWPRSAAVGHLIKLGDAQSNAPWLRVRGVVGNRMSYEQKQLIIEAGTDRIGKVYRLMTDADSVRGSIYHRYEATLQVRVDSEPQVVASTLRQLLRAESTNPPRVARMVDVMGIPRRITVSRFIAALFGTFGVLAVGLACMGVYGIVAQAVADRRREIAIRIALGATPSQIVRALLREHNVLVLLGVAIGLVFTGLTMEWLGDFTGPIGYVGVAIYGTMCVVMFIIIVITALVPAVRATRTSPMEVLRAE